MSSTCSAASAASASGSKEPECEPSPSAKSNPIAAPSSRSTGRMSDASTTSATLQQKDSPQQQQRATLPLTLSPAAFPVRTSARRELERVWRGREAGFGPNSSVLLASFDRDMRSWRTLGRSLFEVWSEYSGTLPRSGMTRSGTLWELHTSAPIISAKEFGYLPTPRASDASGGGVRGRRRRFWKLVDWFRNTIGPGPMPATLPEMLMGFPEGWTRLEASETPLSRKSPNSSAAPSCKRKV